MENKRAKATRTMHSESTAYAGLKIDNNNNNYLIIITIDHGIACDTVISI